MAVSYLGSILEIIKWRIFSIDLIKTRNSCEMEKIIFDYNDINENNSSQYQRS